MKFRIKETLFFITFLLVKSLFAQEGEFGWVRQIGSSGDDTGISITTDASGNVITTGYFQGTVDFDPGSGTMFLTSNGSLDIFVQKLDSDGNLIWAKQMGGIASDYSNSISLDNFGNIYTTGYFRDTVDFDPNTGIESLASNGTTDAFIQKLDPDGNLIWVKQIGGISNDFGTAIKIDNIGNVYTTGYFSDTVDFDPNAGETYLISNSSSDLFIQKLDVNGNLIWVKQVGGASSSSITIDDATNVYVTGSFNGTTDFDPGANNINLTSNGNIDVFILKLNSTGDLVWVKQMGGINSDSGKSIVSDHSGNVYSIGFFADTVDFDPGTGTTDLISNGSFWDIFVQKLDSNGNLIWVKQIGGVNYDQGHSITIDAIGNIYAMSEFSETIDADPGSGISSITSFGLRDILIQKLNSNGDLIWAKQIGGANVDFASSITVDNNNGATYCTGSFLGTADFNPNSGIVNLTSNGSFDAFIQKLNVGVTGIDENLENNVRFMIYPNPTNGNFKVSLRASTCLICV